MIYCLADKDTAQTEESEMIESAFMKGFSTLDILDIAELTFGDFGCFQAYGTVWIIFFDFFLLVSITLTSLFNGVEQKKSRYTCKDYMVTGLKIIFNDLSFLILRVVKMYKTGHPYVGIIFVTKEIFSMVNRIVLICCRNKNGYNKVTNEEDIELK